LPIVCPRCGTTNEPADRFCGGCGASLDPAVVDTSGPGTTDDRDLDRYLHERRFVVVLFADLAGFTTYTEARDPEVVRNAMTAYFDRARDVIVRFGGVVEKYIGDAVMAVWGATVTHEDDAERAVRAGLELVDVVSQLGDELDLGELSVRVGVLSGEASVAPATPEQGLVVGDLVNSAARLQAIAEPGTVVVGDATYLMLQHAVDFEPLGEHHLRGKAEPMAVWRAIRVTTDRTPRTRTGALEPPFVGRDEELRLLKDALHATERAGRARLVSIVGEAGIGKSRLAWEFRKYVGGVAGDVYWHEGRSPAYDQGLTLWALGEMVRQRAGIAETDDALRSRTKLRTAVTEYVRVPADQEWIEPRLAALLGLNESPTGDQTEFFAAIRSFFHSVAERSTTVLVFEDHHWADTGLLDFVVELVERSPRHPILVLTLARPDLLDRSPGWGAGRRNFTSSHLGPLSEFEMTDLVAGMVSGAGRELTSAIVQRANGIPLYAVELVRMLIADGALELDDGACCTPTRDLSTIRVPDTVRAVIGARLDRLPAATRSMLQDAAVLGTAFTGAALSAMSSADVDEVEGLLEPLVHREVLELESDPRSPERGLYRFVQSMIREVAYERLTRDERRVRHLRAAKYFTELGEPELVGAVAGHFMAAHRMTNDPHDAEVLAADAVAALTDAADRAARLHSHAQSLALLEHALAFATDPETKARLWQRGATSASALAHHETAVSYAYRAYDWFAEHGSPHDVAAAAALVGNQLCHAFRAPEAIDVLEPIAAVDPDFDEAGVVVAASELARAYLMALRDADAADLADRVMGPAERFRLVPTIVDTLITRGTALGNLGRMHEATALLEAAKRHAKERDLSSAELRATNNLAHLLAYDDHGAALETCRSGMELANRLGDVRFMGSFTWAVAAYLDRNGSYEEAQALRDQVRDRIELPAASIRWYELTDLMMRIERGDVTAFDAAHEALDRSLDDADPQSQASVPGIRAVVDNFRGRFEEAFESVMRIEPTYRQPDHLMVALVAATLLRDVHRLEAVADAIAACRITGRMVDALRNAARGASAAMHDETTSAVAAFGEGLAFGWLRVDRAVIASIFAASAGVDVPEARRARDDAFAVFSDVGASGFLRMFSAVMPTSQDQSAAGA
jgi:class 3 adenylate cyclase/tetratricopeptide (TPR) repeat protein